MCRRRWRSPPARHPPPRRPLAGLSTRWYESRLPAPQESPQCLQQGHGRVCVWRGVTEGGWEEAGPGLTGGTARQAAKRRRRVVDCNEL